MWASEKEQKEPGHKQATLLTSGMMMDRFMADSFVKVALTSLSSDLLNRSLFQ